MTKDKLLARLDLCGMLLQSIIDRAEKIVPLEGEREGELPWGDRNTWYIKIDIIKLRRELNDLRRDL